MPKISINEFGYFYDFIHIDYSDLHNFKHSIGDIQNRKIDGVIIRNVLSQQEIREILKNIDKYKTDIEFKIPVGYTFPRSFSEADKNVTSENPFENNFLEWADWRAKFPNMFGCDIEARVENVLNTLSGGKDVKILNGPNDVGCYTPCTIRVLNPNLGGFAVHCGNMFEELNPNLYADLMSKVNTYNQMSYFIQVQSPQRGGELTVYDLEWQPGQMGLTNSVIRLENGNEIDTDIEGTIDKFFLKINPGDMLIFAAGQIWHRVENIRGKSDRITIGGFLGFTKDDKTLTFWS